MTKKKDVYNVSHTSFDDSIIPNYVKKKIKHYDKPTVTQEELDKNYTLDTHSGEYMKNRKKWCPSAQEYLEDEPYTDTFYEALEKSKKQYESQFQPDSIVQSIIDKFNSRAKFGKEKYNADLDRTDFSTLDWIQHAQEELMDGILYLEKLKKTLGGK